MKAILKLLILELFADPEVQKAAASLLSSALKQLQQEKDGEKKISIQEAAERLNVSEATIHSYFNRGVLTRVKIPGSNRTYILETELEGAMKPIRPYQRSP